MINIPNKKSVYITGIAYESVSVSHAGYWLDGKWNPLVTPPGTVSSEAFKIFIAGTDVYITGRCKMKTISQYGYWINGEWRTLDKEYKTGVIKTADGIAVSKNGDVYINGIRFDGFKNSLLKSHAGYWLNNCWYDLPFPSSENRSETNGIIIEDGDVYISGLYQDKECNYLNYCYWKDGLLFDLSAIEKGSPIISMVVSGGKVYALESTGYWINDTWHKLPRAGDYNGIAVSGNDVYVIDFSDGYWLNETWNNLSKPDTAASITLEQIVLSENDLYIVGHYHDIYKENKPCYWLNGVLYSLALPYGFIESYARDIAVIIEDDPLQLNLPL